MPEPTQTFLGQPQITPDDGPNARVVQMPDGRILAIRQTDGKLRPVDRGIDAVARTAHGEGRGEGAAGMAAVGAVIKNRGDHWGRDYYDVAHEGEGGQFNVWKMQRRRLLTLAPDSPEYQAALEAVIPIYTGDAPDPTKGAMNFQNPAISGFGKMDGTEVVIGNHLFRRGEWGKSHNPPKPAMRPTNTGWPDERTEGDTPPSWPEHPGLGLRYR
jgi:N-acetylmuramoyl-L-alanine amidase